MLRSSVSRAYNGKQLKNTKRATRKLGGSLDMKSDWQQTSPLRQLNAFIFRGALLHGNIHHVTVPGKGNESIFYVPRLKPLGFSFSRLPPTWFSRWWQAAFCAVDAGKCPG